MKSPSIEVPALDPAAGALQKMQMQLLRQQMRLFNQQSAQQRALLPMLAKEAGFQLKIDPKTGRIMHIKRVQSELEQQDESIRKLMNERSLKALRGELDVDPALERELGTQEQTLRERLQRQFGEGYETSTGGIQTLDEFFRSAEGLRSDARRGELTLAEQLGMARSGFGLSKRGADLDILNGGAVGNPLALFTAGNNLSGTFGNAMGPYLQQQQLAMQAAMGNAQLRQQNTAGWGNLAGTLLGTIMSGGFGGFGGGGLSPAAMAATSRGGWMM